MSVQLNINKHDVSINPKEIPTLKPKTTELFKNILGDKNVPSILTSLKDRFEKLETKIKQHQAAKSSAVKDKILAFLATIFLVGVLAASITLFAAGPPGLNIGLGGALLSLYVVLTEVYNQNFKNDPDSTQVITNNMNPWTFLKVLVAGPFIPIHQAFRKAPNLKSEELNLTEDAAKEIIEVHNFYKANQAKLERGLNAAVANDQKPNDERAALKDLKDSAEYFAKFFANR